MTSLFPEISDDLAEAAERAVRPRRRRVLPFVGGGMAIVAVAGVATAATGVWRPQIGDERRGTPSISGSAVPADQLSLLKVLRRPPQDEDHSAEVRRVLKLVGRGYRGVRTDAVRLLAPAAGATGAQILIPAERAHGLDDALCLYVVDPADGAGSSCFSTENVTAGEAILMSATPAPWTAAQRRQAVRATRTATRKNEAARRALRRSLEPLPQDAGARRRLLQRKYAANGLLGVSVQLPPERFLETDYFGLVPDGVATVTRVAKDGTIRASVRSNLFRIRVPQGTMNPGVLTWRDGRGRTIKTIPGH